MHKENLVIIGASGHGKVAAEIALLTGRYKQIYFLDDSEQKEQCLGFAIMGKTDQISEWLETADFFVAIGNAKVRQRFMEELQIQKASIATLVHPNAIIGKNVKLGKGTVVMAGAIVNVESSVGKGCIVNTGATVDHDCVLEDYVHVSVGAHLAGTVTVGKSTWIGAGAIVNNNVNIPEQCMLGSGTVVIHDIDISGTYVGVPARKIK